jgi:hypothetical protein
MNTEPAGSRQPAPARTRSTTSATGAAEPPSTRTIHPCLEQLSGRLARREVRWCHLADGPLPDAAGGTLRVLVDPTDLEAAEHAVRVTGGITTPGSGLAHRRTWFLRDAARGTTVTLYVTTRLALGLSEASSLRVVDGVLQRRRDDVVPMIAAAERFWLLLLRMLEGHHPTPAEVRLLRSLVEHRSVAMSPLAEVVTATLGDTWSVSRLLAMVARGDQLPGVQARTVPWWRGRGRHAVGASGPPASHRQLGMIVALVNLASDRGPVLPEPPPWPFPVLVVDVGLGAEDDLASLSHVVRRMIGLAWAFRRGRAAVRAGALVLLENYPFQLWARTDHLRLGARVVRRTALVLFPPPDVIAVVEATTADRGSLHPSPRCPVLSLPASEPAASRRDRLGEGLWAMLGWRVASSGFVGWAPRGGGGSSPPGRTGGRPDSGSREDAHATAVPDLSGQLDRQIRRVHP